MSWEARKANVPKQAKKRASISATLAKQSNLEPETIKYLNKKSNSKVIHDLDSFLEKEAIKEVKKLDIMAANQKQVIQTTSST